MGKLDGTKALLSETALQVAHQSGVQIAKNADSLDVPRLAQTRINQREEVAKTSGPRLAPLAQSSSRERILFQFGDQTVALIARIEAIRDEEEEQLIGQLSALLEEHGLGLGSVTINGIPLVRRTLRGLHQWR
jgi:hypothetical protein